jgi:hypothetical protein
MNSKHNILALVGKANKYWKQKKCRTSFIGPLADSLNEQKGQGKSSLELSSIMLCPIEFEREG